MSESLINVGVSQLKAAEKPSALRTILGSCVGICIYDRMKKIGGLAHILLPVNERNENTPEKFASTAIPLLVQQLIKNGAKKEFMTAKIAGGASMFKFSANVSLGQIGDRNVEETKKALTKLGIPILVEEIGGNSGRVVTFYMDDGRMKIKSNGEEKIYYKVWSL